MKTLILILILPLYVLAKSPSSDPKLMSVSKESQEKLANGDVQITLKVGETIKPMVLKKVKDLASLENLPYELKEFDTSQELQTIKITFKNGLFLEDAINKIINSLP